jgi:hypothetical protein
MENGLIHRILAFGDQLADEVDQAMTRSIRYSALSTPLQGNCGKFNLKGYQTVFNYKQL